MLRIDSNIDSSETFPYGLPIGIEVQSQGNPGNSFLELDGSIYLRSSFPFLWEWIDINELATGTTIGNYGSGDGNSTFSIPDYRGRCLVSLGGIVSGNVGSIGGETTHALSLAEMPEHSHTVSDPDHYHPIVDNGHTHSFTGNAHSHTTTDTGHSHDINYGNVTGTDTIMLLGTITSSTQTSNKLTGIVVNTTVATGSNSIEVTGITDSATSTGITLLSTGTSLSHSNIQPYILTRFWVKASP